MLYFISLGAPLIILFHIFSELPSEVHTYFVHGSNTVDTTFMDIGRFTPTFIFRDFHAEAALIRNAYYQGTLGSGQDGNSHVMR